MKCNHDISDLKHINMSQNYCSLNLCVNSATTQFNSIDLLLKEIYKNTYMNTLNEYQIVKIKRGDENFIEIEKTSEKMEDYNYQTIDDDECYLITCDYGYYVDNYNLFEMVYDTLYFEKDRIVMKPCEDLTDMILVRVKDFEQYIKLLLPQNFNLLIERTIVDRPWFFR